MVDQNYMTLKVRSYLGALSRNACDMLIRNLEASRERGDDDPQCELILEAARPLMRKAEDDAQPKAHRKNLLKRAVFAPLEPFLVASAQEHKLPGRIARPSLDAIWLWLERDVLPEQIAEAQKFLVQEQYEPEVVERVADGLRESVLEAMGHTLDEADGPGIAHQRTAFRVGGEAILTELRDIHGIFQAEPVLAGFIAQLPPVLSRRLFDLRKSVLSSIKVLVEAYPDYVGWISAILLSRCDEPALLAHIAASAAGDAREEKLAGTPYAAMVETLLGELRLCEIMARKAAHHGAHDAVMVASVGRYHALLRDMTTELQFEEHGAWRDRLTAVNRDMSHLVSDELAAAHTRIGDALKVREPGEEGAESFDAEAAAKALRAIRVFAIARKGKDLLGVREAVNRARRSIEQVLDIAANTLVEALRNAVGARREALKEALEHAVGFCDIIFGAEYTRILRRRRDALLEAESRPLAV